MREDARQGTVHLMAVSSREIAGGRSSYEVINQFVARKVDDDDRVRRFDVTLLINGLPMIQIELKNQDHPYMDAFRQIKKYSVQGKYRGLFGLVQMFVVTNGSNTRYIAADTGEKLNEKFLTSYKTQEKHDVYDDDAHRADVINYIVNKASGKCHYSSWWSMGLQRSADIAVCVKS